MPIPSTLAQLEAEFSAQIQSAGQVAVTEANTGLTDLVALLNTTIGPNLVVSSATLALSGTSLVLTGTITAFGTPFHVTLTFTMSAGGAGFSLAFDAVQATDSTLSLTAVVATILPAASNAPALRLSGLEISFNTADKSYLLYVAACPWTFGVGAKTVTVSSSLVIKSSSAVLATTLNLGAATFNVTLTLGKQAQALVGSWVEGGQPLGWDALLQALDLGSFLSLPGNLGNAGLTGAQLTLDLGSHAFSLSGQTATGAAFFAATQVNTTWDIALGFAVGNNWKFSQLSSSFAPLDFLQFQQAYLLLSSFTNAQYQFPGVFPPMAAPIAIVPGLNFGASVSFQSASTSALNRAIGQIVGSSSLNIQGSIGTAQNTKLSASLDGALVISKSMAIDSPQLVILATGPTVEVQGTLVVPVKSQAVDFVGRLSISSTEADFTLDVDGGAAPSLPAPFGFTGVTLQNIGVSLGIRITTPGIDLAMEAVFTINGAQGQSSASKCALEFDVDPDAVNPILLWAQFSELSFPLMFSAFVPRVSLPSLLSSVSLQNLYVYYCEQETVLPDNTPALPGFAIKGTLIALDFTMAASLSINSTSGISGSAAMSPINLANNAVSVTGNSPLGGPLVAFNTLGSPYFQASLNATVLDVASANINATIASDGLDFHLALEAQSTSGADGFSATLICTFADPHNFSASANLAFALDLQVGPISAPQTNIYLGTLGIKTQFVGSLSLAVTSTSVNGSISGTFDGRKLPSISFSTTAAQLKSIPKMVVDQIKSDVLSIYSDLFGSAGAWAGAVSSGVITGVANAATALTGFYQQSAQEAEDLINRFHLRGSLEIHTDQSFPHEDSPGVHADTPAVHIDTNRAHVDGPHVDTRKLGIHVDTHADVGGHVDNTTVPHVDTDMPSHVDIEPPHVDTQTHVDI